MKQNLSILFLGMMLFLAACGGGEGEGGDKSGNDTEAPKTESEVKEKEEPKPVEPVKMTFNDVLSGTMTEKTPAVIEAYMGYLPQVMMIYKDNQGLEVYGRRNQREGFKLDAKFSVGTGKNEMIPLPEKYYQDALKVIDKNGDTIRVTDKVRITGTYKPSTLDFKDDFEVETIEKITGEFDESVFEQAQELTDDIIADTSIKEAYVWMEGKFKLGIVMSVIGGTYRVDFKQKQNKEFDYIKIFAGNGVSNMPILPDNYSNKDFKIIDFKGETHNGAKNKYRVYGLHRKLENSTKPGEFIQYFETEEIVKL